MAEALEVAGPSFDPEGAPRPTGEEPERSRFEAHYAELVARAYPRRPDGRTLFPFRRLFIVARTRPA